MPRNDKGGFIAQEMYWNIGTEDQRGRDGDTSRTAAKKYNDHRHPAYVAATTTALDEWAAETQTESGGGYLQTDANQLIRMPGDLALCQGRLFMSTGTSGEYVHLGGGLGGGIDSGSFTQDSITIPIEMQPVHLVDDVVNLRRIELDTLNFSDVAEQVCFAGDYNVSSATETEVRADIVASVYRDPEQVGLNADEAIFFPETGTKVPIVRVRFYSFGRNPDTTFPMGTDTSTGDDLIQITAQSGNPIVQNVSSSYDVETVQVHPTLTDLLVRCGVRMSTLAETFTPAEQSAFLSNGHFVDQATMEDKFNALSDLYKLDILSIRLKVIIKFGATS